MQTILLCVVILLLATQQICCSPTSLYGISHDRQLVKIDPLSFNFTIVGMPNDIDVESRQGIRIDTPDYFLYWLSHSSNGSEQLSMRSVDRWQSSGTYATNLPFLHVYCFTIDYTTSNNILVYGITKMENRTATIQLGRVNIAADTYVPIADYYYDKGINGATGVVEHNYFVPIYVEAMTWDPKTGLFFFFGDNGDGDIAELHALNANTTEDTVVGRFPGYSVSAPSVSALDPVSRIFYVLATKKFGPNSAFLLSIDIDTGKLTNTVLACADAADCPKSMSVLYNRNDVKAPKKQTNIMGN